jgi:hypothetical protein
MSERRRMMNVLCCYALPIGLQYNVNVTQTLYTHAETLRVQESLGSWILFQSAHEAG